MACRECVQGALHEGTPFGSEQKIYALPTYVTTPANGNSKGSIVIITDAFGWKLVNNRILADNYADRIGCCVLVPDFMDGHSLDPSVLELNDNLFKPTSWWGLLWKGYLLAKVITHMIPFLIFNRASVCKPRICNWFKALREGNPDAGIGAAGFCWGGKHVVYLCSDVDKTIDGKSLIDAGFTAHPSFLTIPADIEAVQKPLSNAIGDADMALPHKKSLQAKKILESKGTEHEWVIIPGARHGFAIRGSENNELEVRQGMQAEDQAVEFFKKNLN